MNSMTYPLESYSFIIFDITNTKFPKMKQTKKLIPNNNMIQIWMEGYAATGECSGANLIWQGEAEDFDDAVCKYNQEQIEKYGKPSAEPYTRNCFFTQEAYENRRSNWKIWGCALFDNEQDARKSFG